MSSGQGEGKGNLDWLSTGQKSGVWMRRKKLKKGARSKKMELYVS